MPGPKLEAVAGASELPPRADVVVVGGGIIGTTTALELAERGLEVVLCEKGMIAGEQSSRNWGWVRLTGRDPREIDLMIHSIRLWEGLGERVGAEVGYRQCGIVVPFFDDAIRDANEEWLPHVEGRQTRTGIVDAATIERLMPGLAVPYSGGVFAPRDGRAEPQLAAPAVARAAIARGVTVLTGCAVRRIDLSGGAVSGVVTERGRVAAPRVVVAGGAWSRLLLRGAGVALPQLKVINTVMRTTPVPDGPDITVRGLDFAVRKRADGGYTISTLATNRYELTPDTFRFFAPFLPALRREWRHLSLALGARFMTEWRENGYRGEGVSPFETTRILDPDPDTRMADRAFAAAKAVIPALRNAETAQRWAGMMDVTPDAVPVISPVANRPGLVVATGFSGHGFGLGPGAGRLTADLVSGDAPVVDPTPFRLSRFSDGSPIVPLSGL
ncbi:MAG: FAD-binding oxidoreductase [Acuticoccus sp.]